MYIGLVKREPVHTTENMGELLMRSGWSPLSKCVHCKILPHMDNATCILTINDDTYQITINNEIIPLNQWGFPVTITANVICALSTFLTVIRLCEGVKIGNEKILLTKSTSIQIRNGQQYLKHVQCSVILPMLNHTGCCLQCKQMHRDRVHAMTTADTAQVSDTIHVLIYMHAAYNSTLT